MTPLIEPEMSTMIEAPASELECLEAIVEQRSLRGKEAQPHRSGKGYRWCISPNIERASVARERKPVVVSKPEKQSTAAEAPPPSTPAEVTDYDSLIALLRSRADELQISRATIDHIAGLPDRLSNKILGLSQIRRIGMASRCSTHSLSSWSWFRMKRPSLATDPGWSGATIARSAFTSRGIATRFTGGDFPFPANRGRSLGLSNKDR
jgi:hypothetical protein